MTKVLFVIVNGSEEVEISAPFDYLKRARAKLVLAKVPMSAEDAANLNVTLDLGLKIIADTTLEEAAKKPWELIFVPGGLLGTANLAKSQLLIDLLKKQKEAKKWIAASVLHLV